MARGPSPCTMPRPCRSASSVPVGWPAEQVELELVGGDDVGRRHRMVAHEFGDPGPDEDAAPDVADHRIAAIERLRVRGPHPLRRPEDRKAGVGGAHIARQDPVATRQHAALGHALDALADQPRIEHLAAPGAVARVVGELDGVDRPDFMTHPLHREDRGRIADMAIGHVRLDREDVHPQILLGPAPPGGSGAETTGDPAGPLSCGPCRPSCSSRSRASWRAASRRPVRSRGRCCAPGWP